MAGAVRAESPAEYGNPDGMQSARPAAQRAPDPAKAAARAPEQAQPVARPAPRPAIFAPAAAVHAKRMTPQQREERRFLKDAAASSRFEAEASRLALGKSHDAGVRSIATTLINHNATVSNELLHMLHARGMAAPMLGNDQRRILNRLAKLQGSKFDREYLQEVALRHQQEDIDQYEKASEAAHDGRLKAWIDRKLPTLRYHLTLAERVAPADVKLARANAMPQAAPVPRPLAAALLPTQAMGAGPLPPRGKRAAGPQDGGVQSGGMRFGGMQFGGDAQLGVTRPVAARPTESNTR